MIKLTEKLRKTINPTKLRVFSSPIACISLKEEKRGFLLKQSSIKSPFEKNLKNVLVLFSGGPAPGGHNCIVGIYDAIVKYSPSSKLFGCIQGTSGLLSNNLLEISKNFVKKYLNTGGFDMLGSSRLKLNKKEQFVQVQAVCQDREINAIII